MPVVRSVDDSATRANAASNSSGRATISTPTLLPPVFSLMTTGNPSSASARSRTCARVNVPAAAARTRAAGN